MQTILENLNYTLEKSIINVKNLQGITIFTLDPNKEIEEQGKVEDNLITLGCQKLPLQKAKELYKEIKNKLLKE